MLKYTCLYLERKRIEAVARTSPQTRTERDSRTRVAIALEDQYLLRNIDKKKEAFTEKKLTQAEIAKRV